MPLRSRSVLVGRGWELGQLDRFVAAIRSGDGPVLAVRGPAGIGKTALLRAVRSAASDCCVVTTVATESGSTLPYLGLADLCEPLLGHLDGLPARQAAALRGALAIGPAAAGDDLAVALAAHALLRAEAAGRPVLVAVDDVHWLDDDTARFLEYLAQRLGLDRIGLLLALRDDDVPAWVAPLPAIVPAPLDETDARALVRATVPDLNPAAVDAVLRVSAGNPLALLDLPSALDEKDRAGLLAPTEPLVLSRRLQDAYERRLAGLSRPVQQLVLLVAAAESATRAELVAAAARLGLDDGVLRTAEDAGMVEVTPERVQIAHPLVRSAAYHRMAPNDRRDAHQALGEVIAGPHRAWHLAAASTEPDDEVAALLEEVAKEAVSRHAHAAAGRAFRRAAELSTSADGRDERLVHAILVSLAGSDWRTPRAWLAELGARDDRPGHLRRLAAWAEGYVLRASVETVGAAVPVFTGLGALLTDPLPARAADAYADAALAALTAGDNVTALHLAERARALLGDTATAADRCPTLTALVYGLVVRGQPARARAATAELDAAIDDVPPGSTALRSVPLALQARAALGNLDELRKRTRHLTVVTREAGAHKRAALFLTVLADLSYRVGDWAACDEEITEAVAVCRQIGQPVGLYYALAVEARLRAARGEVEQAHRLAAEVLDACRPPGSDVLACHVLAALGLLELGSGNMADAIERLGSVDERMRDQGLEEPSLLPWRADLVEALVAAGRRDDAEVVLAELERQAAACESAAGLAMAARGRGMLAGDDYEEHFRIAMVWHDRLPMPFERARTELALGGRLRRANRRADARLPLRSAMETFLRLGARPWADRATEELRAAGGRLRSPRTHPTELTEREARVAAAAASGATNREIAAELFISVKTVEFHLARVFDKLGVRTRSQLAARMVAGDAQDETSTTLPSLPPSAKRS